MKKKIILKRVFHRGKWHILIGFPYDGVLSAPAETLKSARRESGDEIRGRELGMKALEGLDRMRRYLDEVRYSGYLMQREIPSISCCYG